MSQSLYGIVLYHWLWRVGNGPSLLTYALAHHNGDNYICVVRVWIFWGRCSGIYLVLLICTLVWRVKPFVSCSPSPILCHNILILPIILKFHNTFWLCRTYVWYVVHPYTALQSHSPLTITLWDSTYNSTILVCDVSDITHVVLGVVWVIRFLLYLTREGRTFPVVSRNTHIHCVSCLRGSTLSWFHMG